MRGLGLGVEGEVLGVGLEGPGFRVEGISGFMVYDLWVGV